MILISRLRVLALLALVALVHSRAVLCGGNEVERMYLNDSIDPSSRNVQVPDKFDLCPKKGDVFINVGGKSLGNGFRCDIGGYASSKSKTFESTKDIELPGKCTEQYKSHRWGVNVDVKYTIPMPQGKFKVYLMFMETYKGAKAGFRKFTIYINNKKLGQPLDIFSKVGLNKPLFIDAGEWDSQGGYIVIELDRFFNGNNPLLSGLGLVGTNADAYVGNTGLNSCDPTDQSDLIIPEGTEKEVSEEKSEEPAKEETKTETNIEKNTEAKTKTEAETKTETPAPEGAYCPKAKDFFLNAGGKNNGDGFRCDNGDFASTPSAVYEIDETTTAQCSAHYYSHRFATGGSDLTYTFPVPKGTYTVVLMFMEVWAGAKVGTRQFTAKVNGKDAANGPIDVKATVDYKKPMVLKVENVHPASGVISIVLGRLKGKNNPMISGIGIVGDGATDILGRAGLTSCESVDIGEVQDENINDDSNGNTVQTSCEDKDGQATTNFADFHLAHAVSGGPYVETDFKKDGRAAVTLNGEGSHSHATTPENGRITKYRWTWNDPNNDNAKNGVVSMESASGVLKTSFPLGITEIELEVYDQYCNKAMEKTTVTINPSTKPGAYCYFYDFGESEPNNVPIFENIKEGPKPQYAANVGDINFGSTSSFGDFKFSSNSFATRCVFSIEVNEAEEIAYKVVHNGPIEVYYDGEEVGSANGHTAGQTTTIQSRNYDVGLHHWQILYFRPSFLQGQLKFQFSDGGVIPASTVRHDAASILPVITTVTKKTALPGEFITIMGSAFVNDATVRFGSVVGAPVESSAVSITLRVPTKNGRDDEVEVQVQTEAGFSNGVKFTYRSVEEPCENPSFIEDNVRTFGGNKYNINDIAVLKYGPDARLYCGTQRSEIHVLTLNQDLRVSGQCSKRVDKNSPRRWVLGIDFDPASSELEMYFSSNTFNWEKLDLIKDFAQGWTNGKVQKVTLNSPTSCFNDDIKDVVTGLPVSNHDHGINFLQFMPDGRLLMSVGGFTNGGVTDPSDALGGIPPNPYSGTILSCPKSGAHIKYSNYQEPHKARVIGGDCQIYAPGLRNSFSGELHTNGQLYVTDNGPNKSFGEFSTDCHGGWKASKNIPDKLFKVEKGKCHGHPHIPRGLAGDDMQCRFEDPRCVQPLLSGLSSSTNGVLEYRSNYFAQKLKGDLFLAKFADSGNKKGRLTRVRLNSDGNKLDNGVTNFWYSDSGLSIVEGPRGEIICSRVFKNGFFVLRPQCRDDIKSPYLIGVHPRRGPKRGGHKVTISGFKFENNPSAKFGGKNCDNVQIISDKAFTCFTPPGTGQVKVVVTTDDGENFATKGTDYWYW